MKKRIKIAIEIKIHQNEGRPKTKIKFKMKWGRHHTQSAGEGTIRRARMVPSPLWHFTTCIWMNTAFGLHCWVMLLHSSTMSYLWKFYEVMTYKTIEATIPHIRFPYLLQIRQSSDSMSCLISSFISFLWFIIRSHEKLNPDIAML